MSDLNDLFIHLQLQNRIDRVEQRMARSRQITRRTAHETTAKLQTQVLILSLVNKALLEILADKGVATEAEIRTKIQQVADGHMDGWGDATPDGLAQDLDIDVESPAEKKRRSANKEKLARDRLRQFRRNLDE